MKADSGSSARIKIYYAACCVEPQRALRWVCDSHIVLVVFTRITVQEIRKQAEFLIGLKEHLNQSFANPTQWQRRSRQYTGALCASKH